MFRTSMWNVVRMTVLIVVVLVAGGIGLAAASELLPNFQKTLAPPHGIRFLTQGT
jgi:hypothetical protein